MVIASNGKRYATIRLTIALTDKLVLGGYLSSRGWQWFSAAHSRFGAEQSDSTYSWDLDRAATANAHLYEKRGGLGPPAPLGPRNNLKGNTISAAVFDDEPI